MVGGAGSWATAQNAMTCVPALHVPALQAAGTAVAAASCDTIASEPPFEKRY